MAKSELDKEIFDPYGPEVLAANGIERDPSSVRMTIKRWAYLVCIAREAKLMREWVIHGHYSSSDPDCILSNQIREHALSLMLHRGSGSVAAMAGAAMVGAAKEAKLLCERLREDMCVDVALCDEIREETRAILIDLCNEASAIASKKNNIAAADDDGVEKSVARYLGSTISRIDVAGKRENKKDMASKLGEKGKRASEATDSHGSTTPSQHTPATRGRRDLTTRTERRQKDTSPVKARAHTPPPSPETTIVTKETKIDMILSTVTGMVKDIAIIDERQKKMVRNQKTRDIGRDMSIDY